MNAVAVVECGKPVVVILPSILDPFNNKRGERETQRRKPPLREHAGTHLHQNSCLDWVVITRVLSAPSALNMTGSSLDFDGVTYEVDFRPNMPALFYENIKPIQEEPPGTSSDTSTTSTPSSGDSNSDEDDVVGDVMKNTKKNRFGLTLPSKLKKKLKSRTNKKVKGKSKMASLLSTSATEPSQSLIQKWKGGIGYKKLKDPEESSGSLFAGRLEEGTITKLATIQESSVPQEEPSTPRKCTQNLVVEERTEPRKKRNWKLVKRFLKKLKNKDTESSSQSSVADTASTSSSSPRTHIVEESYDVIRDDTEVAMASEEDTFFSLTSSEPITTTTQPSLPSNSSKVLPPSLTLVRPSSVARQASGAANFVWNGSVQLPIQEVDYPSDEEDSSVDSIIVSPVPSPPSGNPRKKILNYKKAGKAKKKTASVKKAPVNSVAASRWNVWALLLATVLCALSVWQKCIRLPRRDVSNFAVASQLNSDVASISFLVSQGEGSEMKEDSEWPYDECSLPSKTPVSSFDEHGFLDCAYDNFYF